MEIGIKVSFICYPFTINITALTSEAIAISLIISLAVSAFFIGG